MNLIEAIKSEKLFRRKEWDSSMWCHVVDNADGIPEVQFCDGSLSSKAFLAYVDDVTADDWEVEEPSVTITASQFWDAFSGALKWWEQESRPTFTRFDTALHSPDRFASELALRLGLGIQ